MDTLEAKLQATIAEAFAGDPVKLERRIELAKMAKYRPLRGRIGWSVRTMPGEPKARVHLRSGTEVPV